MDKVQIISSVLGHDFCWEGEQAKVGEQGDERHLVILVKHLQQKIRVNNIL
jgi:hypothetical protein